MEGSGGADKVVNNFTAVNYGCNKMAFSNSALDFCAHLDTYVTYNLKLFKALAPGAVLIKYIMSQGVTKFVSKTI